MDFVVRKSLAEKRSLLRGRINVKYTRLDLDATTAADDSMLRCNKTSRVSYNQVVYPIGYRIAIPEPRDCAEGGQEECQGEDVSRFLFRCS
jgi:hypothetical protein